MLWFCAALPAFGLEVCARRMLDSDRPAVLVEDNRVVACNDAAYADGITIGSSLATAHSISRELEHFCRDVDAERHRLRFLADTAYRFSGSVSIQEPAAILIEVDGSLRLFGGLYALKRGLINAFAELGHRIDVGIAHTPLAAFALARAREHCDLPRWPAQDELRTTALEALRRISLRHAELDAETIERFSNMGIETFGQVFRLPTAELGRRFGPKLLDYLERMSGKRPDPRIYVTPAAHFSTELNLLQSISNKEALAFPMQRLAQDLGNWLVGRQLGVERIGWQFAPFNSAGIQMEIEFATPQQNKQALLAISRLKLESIELPEDILSIRLRSVRLAAWQGENNGLFARAEGAGQSPAELVDQFKARLGDDVCIGISVNDDHRPELAWKATAPGVRGVVSHSQRRTPLQSTVQRPLELLRTPKPVRRRQLVLLRGPERIDAGWWMSADVDANDQRDYFVARHTNGSQCWVFVDRHGDWFIHGYFS